MIKSLTAASSPSPPRRRIRLSERRARLVKDVNIIGFNLFSLLANREDEKAKLEERRSSIALMRFLLAFIGMCPSTSIIPDEVFFKTSPPRHQSS
jgi:hypothetical protein